MMTTTKLTMEQEKKRCNYKALFEIKTKAKTETGVFRVLKKNIDEDFYEEDNEVLRNLINSEWVTVCKDGVIIWCDGIL